MAEVGVLNLTIRDNSEEAGKGLDALARALSAVKTAMQGFDLSAVGQQVAALTRSIDKTQKTTIKNLTGLFNAVSEFGKVNSININTEQFEDLRSAVGDGLKIGDAGDQVKQLQETLNGDWGDGASKVTEQFEQMSMDLDGMIRSVEGTTEKIEGDMQAFASNLNAISLDFSKFDPSNLPIGALGMTAEEFRHGGAEAQRFGDILKDTDRIVSQMKDDLKVDTFQESQNTGLIVYNENLENSWQRIAERTAEAKREFDEYCEGQKKAIFGNESIKPLWENPLIGPSLQGMFGKEQQWSMIEQISSGTGLSTDNIVDQLYTITNGLVDLRQTTTDTVDEMQTKLNGIKMPSGMTKVEDSAAKSSAGFNSAKDAIDTLKTSSDELTSSLKELDSELKLKGKDANAAASGMTNLTNNLNSTANASNNLTNNVQDTVNVANRFGDANGSFNQFIENIRQGTPHVRRFGNEIWRIIRRMAIRWAIKQITSGIKEGVENVYWYSQAISGSFAPAMDSAASSLATMRNSVGAALAPAIQALIPVLQTVVNWFITAINYVNQFFSLLNGQATWTKALPATTKAFDDQKKAAKGAGAAIKDLLADWDELNIIQSQSGGGGGGSDTSKLTDALKSFEEIDKFSKKIQAVVDFIKEHFDTIKTIAEAIGAAILAWKISKAFGNTLSLLQTLELAAGLTLIISGFKMTTAAGYDIGKNGLNNENLLQAVGGVLEMALGTALVGVAFGGITGGLIGLVAGAAIGLFILHANIKRGHLDSLYGDVNRDVEDIIEDLENGILSPEARLQIEVVNAQLKSTEEAESKVEAALVDLQKNYPFNVEITPENAEDFKSKIATLVTETNNLIGESKSTLHLTVPATAAFTDDFVDKSWSNVSGYVTLLGEKIGKELDRSITDNTKLNDLREKLLNISKTVLNATRSSEVTSQVSVLGASVRENLNAGVYSRETVDNYIDEYNKFLEGKMGEATGYAQAEYIEKKRLIASLEETAAGYEDMIEKGELDPSEVKKVSQKIEEINGQLQVAREELIESFGENGENISQKAKEYFDEWTAVGRELFGQDIAGALKVAIKNNDQKTFEKWLINSFYGNVNLDKVKNQTEEYATAISDWLYKTISEETGMDRDALKTMFDYAGISPVDVFGDDFAREFKTGFLSVLERAGLSEDEQRKAFEMLGLDFDWEKRQKELQREINMLVPDASSDQLKRKVLDYGDHIETVLSETFTAGPDGNGFEWKEPLILNMSPILANGEKLTDESLRKYVEDLLYGAADVDEIIKRDNPKNGGLGLYLSSETGFGKDYEGATKRQVDDMVKLHKLEEEYYEKAPKDQIVVPVEVEAEYVFEDDLSELYTELAELVQNTDFGVFEGKNKLQEKLMDLFESGNYQALIDFKNLIDQLGIDTAKYYTYDENGWTRGSGMNMKGRMIASAGMSDVGSMWISKYKTTTGQGQAENIPTQADIEAGVQKGTQRANESQNDLIRQLITLATRIANKEWTVKLTPSSTAGRINQMSADAFSKVTG